MKGVGTLRKGGGSMARHRIVELVLPPINFEREASDPDRWWATGADLLAAAALIWPQVSRGLDRVGFTIVKSLRPEQAAQIYEPLRYRGPFFLLAGLAVENCLKAVIVGRMKRSNETLAAILATVVGGQHRLLPLCAKANIALADRERELLNRLTMYVQWAGRYPVATTKKRTVGELATKVDDLENVHAFLGRVGQEYKSLKS